MTDNSTEIEQLYRDALRYDAFVETLIDDLPFYLNQLKTTGDPVLELACGTGRLTIPIAVAGYQIVGLDLTETMLELFRQKMESANVEIDLVKADMRDFSLNRKFRTIIIPFNSLLHLCDLRSIEACFSCIKNHLHPDGRLMIDIFNPAFEKLTRDLEGRYDHMEFPDPHGKGQIQLSTSNQYDAATQINTVRFYFSTEEHEDMIEYHIRILWPQEIDALLHYNGFKIIDKYGNYDGSPFCSSSPKQLLVCSV